MATYFQGRHLNHNSETLKVLEGARERGRGRGREGEREGEDMGRNIPPYADGPYPISGYAGSSLKLITRTGENREVKGQRMEEEEGGGRREEGGGRREEGGGRREEGGGRREEGGGRREEGGGRREEGSKSYLDNLKLTLTNTIPSCHYCTNKLFERMLHSSSQDR